MKHKISLFLCLIMLFSLLSMTGVTAANQETVNPEEIEVGATTVRLPACDGVENIIKNGDLEELDENNTPVGWTSRCYNMENGTGASIVSGAEAYKGNSLKLVGGEIPANYPFILQDFVTKGRAMYQMRAMVYKDGGKSAMTVKLEFWPEMLPGAKTVQESNTFSIRTTEGGWQEVLFNFVAPFTAKSVSFLARLHDESGEACYFDDISVYMVRPPEMMQIVPDAFFYYPEQEEGMATVKIATEYFPEAVGGSVDVSLLDGETVLSSGGGQLNEKSEVEFRYQTSFLKELKKEYILKAVLKDKDGKTLDTKKETIYKFERPKYLSAEGIYQAKGEEPFYPVGVYHAWSVSDFPKLKEAGINVVQGNEEMIEEAGKHGLKILMVLYPGMQAAGHEQNRDFTIDVVTKYKDDPRIFAWAVMDEPFLRLADPLPDLKESYRLIRSIDDNHPVFICEPTKQYFPETVKCVDLLAHDPYLPATKSYSGGQMNTTHVFNGTMDSIRVSNGLKPTFQLLQALYWYDYLPDADAERHMIYQAYMAGAKGHGYYSWDDPMKLDGKNIKLYQITQTDIYKGICSFAENEQQDVFKHFVEKEYPGFCHYIDNDVMYHGYIKNGKLYMIVMNQSITDEATFEIPLKSFDGNVTINKYLALCLYGAEEQKIKGNSDVLKVTVPKHGVAVWELSSFKGVDFSKLDQDAFWDHVEKINLKNAKSVFTDSKEKTTYFTDLADYAWAEQAIEQLYKNGIVNTKGEGIYAPAEKITRGDFAMFLIRTLGLAAESEAEQFADVDPTAEYAEAVAIGKSLGILNGVGENKFMPEAEITRQDLMAICARGMRLIKELPTSDDTEKTDFSDWEIVADYAEKDIVAMVQLGIIQGNADGSLNPIGHTTRAEAAVIMERIAEWNK